MIKTIPDVTIMDIIKRNISFKSKCYLLYHLWLKRYIPVCFYTRPVTRVIKKQNKQDLVGCEIGVSRGYNAITMLKTLPIGMLYLIDISYEKNTLVRFYNYSRQVRVVSGKSQDVANKIRNDLDFVYIDGSHEYEDVLNDIKLYYPKVKEGGIVGGHDFRIKDVLMAVIKFELDNNLKLHTKKDDWWFEK